VQRFVSGGRSKILKGGLSVPPFLATENPQVKLEFVDEIMSFSPLKSRYVLEMKMFIS